MAADSEIYKMEERKSPARGILHPASMAGQTVHRRYLPCNALAEWIEHFWIVEWNFGSSSKLVSTLPHPSVHITISADESAVGGIGTGRFVRTLSGRGRVFGIKFLPGAFYPWFRQPVSSIANKKLPLGSFFNNFVQTITLNHTFRRNANPEAEQPLQLPDAEIFIGTNLLNAEQFSIVANSFANAAHLN